MTTQFMDVTYNSLDTPIVTQDYLFRSVPVRWVPTLESDTSKPVYSLKGHWLKERSDTRMGTNEMIGRMLEALTPYQAPERKQQIARDTVREIVNVERMEMAKLGSFILTDPASKQNYETWILGERANAEGNDINPVPCPQRIELSLVQQSVLNRLYDSERERDKLAQELKAAKAQWQQENISNQGTIKHFKDACERLNGELAAVEGHANKKVVDDHTDNVKYAARYRADLESWQREAGRLRQEISNREARISELNRLNEEKRRDMDLKRVSLLNDRNGKIQMEVQRTKEAKSVLHDVLNTVELLPWTNLPLTHKHVLVGARRWLGDPKKTPPVPVEEVAADLKRQELPGTKRSPGWVPGTVPMGGWAEDQGAAQPLFKQPSDNATVIGLLDTANANVRTLDQANQEALRTVETLQAQLKSSEAGRRGLAARLERTITLLSEVSESAGNLLGCDMRQKAAVMAIRDYLGAPANLPGAMEAIEIPESRNVGLAQPDGSERLGTPVTSSFTFDQAGQKVERPFAKCQPRTPGQAFQNRVETFAGILKEWETTAQEDPRREGRDIGPDALGVWGIYRPGRLAALVDNKIRWVDPDQGTAKSA